MLANATTLGPHKICVNFFFQKATIFELSQGQEESAIMAPAALIT